jgi:hypothetical protein
MDKLTKAVYLVIFLFCAIGIVPVMLSLVTGSALIPAMLLIIGFLIAVPILIIKHS